MAPLLRPAVMFSEMQQEIAALSTVLLNAHNRLSNLARWAEDQSQHWETSFTELEIRHAQCAERGNMLRIENEDLKRRLEGKAPALDNAIDARDAAFRRLRHAERFIKDLLQERVGDIVPEVGSDDQIEEEIARREMTERALRESNIHDDATSESTSKTPTSSSGITLRRGLRTRKAITPAVDDLNDHDDEDVEEVDEFLKAISIGSDVADSNDAAGLERDNDGNDDDDDDDHNRNTEISDDEPELILPTPELSSVAIAEQVQPQVDEQEDAADDRPVRHTSKMKIHHSKPPRSAVFTRGPWEWNELQQRLDLPDGLMGDIVSLGASTDLCVHVNIEGDLAFIYDPAFLEADGESYLIDWGIPLRNQLMEEYLMTRTRPGNADVVLHTFVFPVVKGKWYYIGAQDWGIRRDVARVWPSLSSRSRERIVHKLMRRSLGLVERERLEEMLESDELEQLTIRLSGKDHPEASASYYGSFDSGSNSDTPSRRAH